MHGELRRARQRTRNIHPDDFLLFQEVSSAMRAVAKQYGLPLPEVEPHPDPEAPIPLGLCFADHRIYLVLRFKVRGKWTEARRAEDVWKTAAHELAHLRHMNHGIAFQEFELELIQAMCNKKPDHENKLIEKLVKMQASRDSEAAIGNSAAAEAFAGMINKLLIENELSPSDLDYARADQDDPVIQMRVDLEKYAIPSKRMRIAWQETLARVIAKAHLCQFLISIGRNQIYFVGTKSHATVAEYAFGTLVPMAVFLANLETHNYKKLCSREQRKKDVHGFHSAWLSAFVQRIAERMAKAREEAVAAAPCQSTALVRLNGALLKTQKYIDDRFGKHRGAHTLADNGGFHKDGSRMGREAADRMEIGRKGIGPQGLLA